jgi:hypothetical protein
VAKKTLRLRDFARLISAQNLARRKVFFSHRLKRLKGFFELPPALAGGIKVDLEKALAKKLLDLVKACKLNYFSIQLKLEAAYK